MARSRDKVRFIITHCNFTSGGCEEEVVFAFVLDILEFEDELGDNVHC